MNVPRMPDRAADAHDASNVILAAFDRSARTALADTWAASWPALLDGVRPFSGVGEQIAGWPDDLPVASLRDWPHGAQLPGRARALAVALGEDSRQLHDALLALQPGLSLSVLVATSHGDTWAVSQFAAQRSRPEMLQPEFAQTLLGDVLLDGYLEGLGKRWPGLTVSAACASACVATGMAAARIRQGGCDACLVVSLDVLSRIAHAGFRQIGAMSPQGCRPFDRQRNGTTIGEAGAVYLLAGSHVQLPPMLRWRVKVCGFGQSCDARHPVEPGADGLERALRAALAEAACQPGDLAGVYWHGTGTVQNDRTEAVVAQRLFGNAAPPGTSTKGSFGHAMGASAALSILACGETLQSGHMPQVAGLEDSEFPDMHLVQGSRRRLPPGPLAVAALGFGGINAALILSTA